MSTLSPFERKTIPSNIVTPSGDSLRSLGGLVIPEASQSGDVAIGFARNTTAKERELPADGVVFVDMDDAGLVKVPAGRPAQVYTKSLAGCTGIAGLAKTSEGSFAGVSHFDPMVDRWQREGGASPSEKFMYTFAAQARQNGAEAVELRVAYNRSHEANPEYGERKGTYGSWFFLDQLETAAQYIGKDVSVTFIPYEGDDHTLAVAIDPSHSSEILFE